MPTNRIDSVHIAGTPPITEELDLTLDPRVNLLIGPNGCGKSTVLRTIVTMLQDPYHWFRDPWYRVAGQSQIDLRHELREVHGARVEFERPDESESAIHNYHDERFARADVTYDNFTYGSWVDDDEQGGELLPDFRIPFVYIPATRLPFPDKDDIVVAHVLSETIISDDVFDSRRVFDAVERFVKSDWCGDEATMSEHERLIYEARTMEPGTLRSEWKDYVLRAGLNDAALARRQALADTIAVCAARMCSEILKPEALSQYSHSTESGLKSERGVTEVTHPYWVSHTHDNSDDPITIGELSAGTQGPLMWLWHLALELHEFFVKVYRHRLTHHRYRRFEHREIYVRQDAGNEETLTLEEYVRSGNPPEYRRRVRFHGTGEPVSWEEYLELGAPRDYCAEPIPLPEEAPDEWRRMPFILLIDEIENHLHPAWQRRVIPALLETFPNMQLIATTHSPFVVAGREAGQVHGLSRDENNVVRVKTGDEDIVGWTVEDILREFMGVDDPTDEDTAADAIVLRWLRNGKPAAGERAEDWKERRLSELSAEDMPDTFQTWAKLRWLQRQSTLSGEAVDWWRDQIEQLEEQVNPRIEFAGPEHAARERYIAELENILWALEERLGEDLFESDENPT